MWHLSETDLTFRVEFLVDGVPVIPDGNAATWTLRDNAGVPIAPHNQEAISVTGTFYDLSLTALENTPAVSGTLESRFILVDFQYQGKIRFIRAHYRLSPFLPVTCGELDVRKQLGLTPEELQDNEIDLYQAYYDLQERVPTLSTLLTSAGNTALKANDAIAIQAALLIAPSLPQRIGQSQKSADASFDRMGKIDPYQLVQDLQAALESLIDDLNTGNAGTVATPVLFRVTARTTDPITGA